MATIPSPADEHEHGDAIDQVERRERIDHIAKTRILQQNATATARQMGRTDEPMVRQALADVYTRERILKFLGMRMQTAIMHKRGTPPDPSVLKNFFTQSLSKRVELAVELEGAGGMLADKDAIQDGFWQKQCMAQFSSRIGGGTNEVHRNMIGERALGLPAEPRTDKDQPWRETTRS